MKFIRFLDDEIKTPSANGALKTAYKTPKLYRRSSETQALRISLLLTISVLIISLLINLMFLFSPAKSKTSQDQEGVEDQL